MKTEITLGQKFGSYTVLAREAKHGHTFWKVACDLCGRSPSLRTSKLSEASCPCTSPARQRAPATQDLDLHQRVADLEQALDNLRDQLAALKPAPPAPARKGIQSFGMASKRKPITRQDVLADWPNEPEEVRFRKSMLAAKGLAEMPERPADALLEINERLTIERAEIELLHQAGSTSPEVLKDRRSLVDRVLELIEP